MTCPTCGKPQLTEQPHQHGKPKLPRWRLIRAMAAHYPLVKINPAGPAILEAVTVHDGLYCGSYIYQRVS